MSRMYEDRHFEPGRLEHRKERRVIEVESVDVGPDLDPGNPAADTALQLAGCRLASCIGWSGPMNRRGCAATLPQ
jgi:hypothetical protein